MNNNHLVMSSKEQMDENELAQRTESNREPEQAETTNEVKKKKVKRKRRKKRSAVDASEAPVPVSSDTTILEHQTVENNDAEHDSIEAVQDIPQPAMNDGVLSHTSSAEVNSIDSSRVLMRDNTPTPNYSNDNQTLRRTYLSLKRSLATYFSSGRIFEPRMQSSPIKHELFNNGEMLSYISDPVMSVKIIKADQLHLSSKVFYPMVKVSIVDTNTGRLIQRSDLRKGSNKFELSKNGPQDYTIAPVMTETYDVRKERSFKPVWNETLIINENYHDLLSENVLFMFELFDKRNITSNVVSFSRISWGFLKPVSSSGRANTESTVRIQLFKYHVSVSSLIRTKLKTIIPPVRSILTDPAETGFELYDLYTNRDNLPLYPSTLYVELSARERTKNEMKRNKSLSSTDRVDRGALDQMVQVDETSEEAKQKDLERRRRRQEIKRRKLKRERNQKCVIPDKLLHQFDSGAKGCLSMQFSNEGRYLAAGCCHSSVYSTVKIFDLWDGKLAVSYSGHKNIIYSVDWSPDDKELITASSDCTVKIWNAKISKGNTKLKTNSEILQHSSFVYVAKYHPISEKTRLIITGSFDRKIRIWNRETKTIMNELVGHMGRVNSISFTPDGTKMFSADATGVIKLWGCRLSKDATEKDIKDSFTLLRTIENDNILGSSLSTILVDPNYGQERLIVHSQDNMIRRIEAFKKSVVNCYSGVKHSLNAQKCNISPCGSYIVSGSDTGRVFYWDVETSKLVHAEGKDYQFKNSPVYNIAWSSKEHLVAFCSFGGSDPIRVYAHEKKSEDVSQEDMHDMQSMNGNFAYDDITKASYTRMPTMNASLRSMFPPTRSTGSLSPRPSSLLGSHVPRIETPSQNRASGLSRPETPPGITISSSGFTRPRTPLIPNPLTLPPQSRTTSSSSSSSSSSQPQQH